MPEASTRLPTSGSAPPAAPTTSEGGAAAPRGTPPRRPDARPPRAAPPLSPRHRWMIYGLLIICATGVMLGRIVSIRSEDPRNPSPMLSANDRSRWCTVRALVDHGTYAIDEVIAPGQKVHWDTIDKVQHRQQDGVMRSYSSKPPLFATMLSGPYWLMRVTTGASLAEDPFLVVRSLLVLVNLLPLVLFFVVIARMSAGVAETEFARVFVLASACFATSLTTFAVTLNNHVPAAVCALLATYFTWQIWRGQGRGWHFAMAGFFAGFAATFELPALALTAALAGLCFLRGPLRTLLGYLPPLLLIAVAFFGTNYLAHGTWKPPYAFRGDGAVVAEVTGNFDQMLDAGSLPEPIRKAIEANAVALDIDLTVAAQVQRGEFRLPKNIADRWVVVEPFTFQRVAITRPVAESVYQIRVWENWYEYPGSYWLTTNPRMSFIDRGESDRGKYAFNMLIGTHGIFSLTPIWLLSFVGLLMAIFSRTYGIRLLALAVLAISVVVFVFYVGRPVEDRNYGGMTSVLRWMLWLAPLWLIGMIPALDRAARSAVAQWICGLFLLASVASAFYASGNPWQLPWLHWLVTGD